MWFQRSTTNGIKITKSRHQTEFMKRKQRNQDIKRNSWNENNEINFSELYELKSENSLKISPRQIFINETEMKFILDIQFIFEPVKVLLKFMYKCLQLYHSEMMTMLSSRTRRHCGILKYSIWTYSFILWGIKHQFYYFCWLKTTTRSSTCKHKYV